MKSPTPPKGFRDFHRHPTVATDTELNELRLTVESSNLNDSIRESFLADEGAQGEWEDDSEFTRAALDYLTASIEFRVDLRPTSLRNLSDLPEQVSRHTGGGWVWYRKTGGTNEPEVSASEADETAHGKYLFFSPDANVLENILLEQFALRPFRSAKIPTLPNQRGDDFVLCLYYRDDRFRHYLADEYGDRDDVKYRHFKADEATRRGDYSEEFLSSLSEEAREAFEGER